MPIAIRYLKISNYRSIDELELHDIPAFAVFAGANGSGKSNFFNALDFVRLVLRFDVKEALQQHGGWENIRCVKSEQSLENVFLFEIEVNTEQFPEITKYQLKIVKLNTDCPEVVHSLPVHEREFINKLVDFIESIEKEDSDISATAVLWFIVNNPELIQLAEAEKIKMVNSSQNLEKSELSPDVLTMTEQTSTISTTKESKKDGISSPIPYLTVDEITSSSQVSPSVASFNQEQAERASPQMVVSTPEGDGKSNLSSLTPHSTEKRITSNLPDIYTNYNKGSFSTPLDCLINFQKHMSNFRKSTESIGNSLQQGINTIRDKVADFGKQMAEIAVKVNLFLEHENNGIKNKDIFIAISKLHQKDKVREIWKSFLNFCLFRIEPRSIKESNTSIHDDSELQRYGQNLAAVLRRLEKDDEVRETIIDWLQLIVPQLEIVQTETERLSGSAQLAFKETGTDKLFPAHLISDGTIYLLCLLVAMLDRPKMGITLIEEPERGLHPKAIMELVKGFREHATIESPIWLTTHSESVVRMLKDNELWLVDKKDGKTQINPVRNIENLQLNLDEAWLSNALNGGLPW